MCAKPTSGAQNIFYRVESSSAGPFTYESTYDNRIFQRNWFTKFVRSGSRIRIRDPGSGSGFFQNRDPDPDPVWHWPDPKHWFFFPSDGKCSSSSGLLAASSRFIRTLISEAQYKTSGHTFRQWIRGRKKSFPCTSRIRIRLTIFARVWIRIRRKKMRIRNTAFQKV